MDADRDVAPVSQSQWVSAAWFCFLLVSAAVAVVLARRDR